jgi:hypothetical protein
MALQFAHPCEVDVESGNGLRLPSGTWVDPCQCDGSESFEFRHERELERIRYDCGKL